MALTFRYSCAVSLDDSPPVPNDGVPLDGVPADGEASTSARTSASGKPKAYGLTKDKSSRVEPSLKTVFLL